MDRSDRLSWCCAAGHRHPEHPAQRHDCPGLPGPGHDGNHHDGSWPGLHTNNRRVHGGGGRSRRDLLQSDCRCNAVRITADHNNADPLVKVGINIASWTSPTFTAPSSGNSINVLIEAAFNEPDTTSVVLPYYNASNPAVAYSGPGTRQRAEHPAAQQVLGYRPRSAPRRPPGRRRRQPPIADTSGFTLSRSPVSTTSITSGNIAVVPAAPFIPFTLPQIRPGFASGVQTYTSHGTNTLDGAGPSDAVRGRSLGCRVRIMGIGQWRSWRGRFRRRICEEADHRPDARRSDHRYCRPGRFRWDIGRCPGRRRIIELRR